MPYKFPEKRTRARARKRLAPGPLKRQGGYSLAISPEMEDALLTQHPEILTYIRRLRKGFIVDICPEGEAFLSTAKRLLLDRLCQKVGWLRVLETYVAKAGMLRRDSLAKGVLSEMPILNFWSNLSNSLRRDLELLGLERRPLEVEALEVGELMEAVARESVQDAEVVEVKPTDDPLDAPLTDGGEEVHGGDASASKDGDGEAPDDI
jgi:hypothetical protein